jgi:hypothetical protein
MQEGPARDRGRPLLRTDPEGYSSTIQPSRSWMIRLP